jgi:hypothetical protein
MTTSIILSELKRQHAEISKLAWSATDKAFHIGGIKGEVTEQARMEAENLLGKHMAYSECANMLLTLIKKVDASLNEEAVYAISSFPGVASDQWQFNGKRI